MRERETSIEQSVISFLWHLVAVLGVSLFIWNVAAPDSWKAAVHAWGDSFVAAGAAANDLQRTSWRHNLGLPGPKYSSRDIEAERAAVLDAVRRSQAREERP